MLWGGNAVVGRLAAEEWQSFTLTFVRWLSAIILLLPFSYRHLKADWPVLRSSFVVLFCMGAFGMGLFNLAMYTALHYTTAVNVSIEQSLMPVLIILANFLFFKQRAAVWQLLGVAISIIGVVITSTHGEPLGFFSGALNRGDLLMLIATLFYAGYTIALRWRPSIHWLSFMIVIGCGAASVCLPFALWEVQAKGFDNPSLFGWSLLVYVVIFPSVVSQLAFARGVEILGGNRAGLFINLVPVFGSFLAVLLIGESFYWYHAVGLGLVLGGIFLAEKSAEKSTDNSTDQSTDQSTDNSADQSTAK